MDRGIKYKVYIEFEIIKNSDITALTEELKMIIGLNKFVITWSKKYSLEEMVAYCAENNLIDYIWDYKLKDSSHYSSVDFLIDNDQKLVDRFARNGIDANFVERIV